MGSLSVVKSNHVFLGQGSPDVRAALVIEGDTIRAVASPEHLAHVVPEGTPVRDFGDAFICPGFHDAHQHVFHTSLFRSDLALSYAGTSEKDCVRRLQEFAADHPGDGWLLGQGFRSAPGTCPCRRHAPRSTRRSRTGRSACTRETSTRCG